MGKITHTPKENRIVVIMSIDELLMSCATMKEGVYMGYSFAGQVAADKVANSRLAPELQKIKCFKIERVDDQIVVTMDDFDPQT
jgi:hypothetical protein